MLLIAASGMPAALRAQEGKGLTVEMTNAPILDVLKAIEAQSDFSFFYNNNLIDPELRVTVSKRNAPIPEVLGVDRQRRRKLETGARRGKDAVAPAARHGPHEFHDV